ncbi:hypothetical protein JMG10_00480 [Nostoc ellipsosporum NOK]|jgi:hypothetical protein|nr:hypothetical protein [Nostoc ellipsosporum NOK]
MMKKTVNFLSCALIAGITLVSCKDKGVKQTDKAMTVATARAMVAAYDNDSSAMKPVFYTNQGQQVQSFTIQAGTLETISKMEGYTGIRLYLAVKDTVNGKPIYTLVVVPRGTPEGKSTVAPNILKDGFIYDWIPTCPEDCPDPSTQLP